MTYLSVCSGIEAATVAWHPLGWTPVAFSEIDRFPCAVLQHHYPTVPNWGDLTRFHEWPDATIDLLIGGTPCQSFSVAGLRAGLADPRGNLALTYLAVADRYRPRWLVWENVPGVLSSNGGRDFGAFLGGLAELGYGFAYRVLDAQYFGLAQRRARVFVVAHLGDWRRAAAVLFERESLSGHPAPRREAGQSAPTLPSRRSAGGGLGTDFDCDGGLMVVGPLQSGGTVRGHGTAGVNSQAVASGHVVPVHAFDARQSDVIQYGDQAGPLDTDGHSIAVACVDVSPTLRAGGNRTGGDRPPGTDVDTCETLLPAGMAVRRLTPRECSRLQGFPDTYLELTYADAAEAHAAQVLHELWRQAGTQAVSEQGRRAGIITALLTPEILLAGVYGGWVSWALATDCANARRSVSGADGYSEGFVRALRQAEAAGYTPYRRESFEQCARELGSAVSVLPLEEPQARAVLRSSELWSHAQGTWPLRYAFATEAQRRSGKSLNPDGPRYKALGNSMAVPVVRWIGQRIQQVEALP